MQPFGQEMALNHFSQRPSVNKGGRDRRSVTLPVSFIYSREHFARVEFRGKHGAKLLEIRRNWTLNHQYVRLTRNT